jgi:carboxyl-terminal processing protease
MGERSFGKGSVQTVLDLGNNAALRLTTSRYYTPSGRSVQEGGIQPDIAVPEISDPDYKVRPVFREDDLRRHLINEVKADNAVLEEDGIDDFQLWYAVQTIGRLGATPVVAAK